MISTTIARELIMKEEMRLYRLFCLDFVLITMVGVNMLVCRIFLFCKRKNYSSSLRSLHPLSSSLVTGLIIFNCSEIRKKSFWRQNMRRAHDDFPIFVIVCDLVCTSHFRETHSTNNKDNEARNIANNWS